MRYLLGSSEDFHNFVNNISKEDKIGVVTHTDVDGIASGIFLQKILESKNLKIDFIEFLNYGAGALEELGNRRDYDKLFFTDWNADGDSDALEFLRSKGDVLVFDHHPLNGNLENTKGIIKTNADYCSSHALFDLAREKNHFNIKDLEWLVCAAIIEDYTWDKHPDNFKLIKSIYPEVKKDISIRSSEPGKIGIAISSSLIYYNPDFKRVYDLVFKKDLDFLFKAERIIGNAINIEIKKFKDNSEHFSKQKLYFSYINSKYNLSSIIASKLSDECFRGSTIIIASKIKDKEGFVKISSRNQTKKVDLGKLLKKCVEGFENASAGGHIQASAASFPKKYLETFKENIIKNL